jgi:hypothetical protein
MLSSLVEYINYLDATVPTGARDTVNQQLLPTLKTVTEHGIQYDGIARALNDQYHSMGLAIDQYINTIDQLKHLRNVRSLGYDASFYDDKHNSDRGFFILETENFFHWLEKMEKNGKINELLNSKNLNNENAI